MSFDRYDTDPSVLQHPLSRATREESGQPSPNKRAKLINGDHADSIANKVRKDQYTVLDDLVNDVDQASSEVLSSLELREPGNGAAQWRYAPASPELDALSAKLRALRKQLDGITKRESALDHTPTADRSMNTNRESLTAEDAGTCSFAGLTANSKTVLTLYGSAQGHKQLFSSLQKPLPGILWSGGCASLGAGTDAHNSAITPIRENGLPPQIFSTKVLPTDSKDRLQNSKRPSKFRDFFAPFSNLPALNPPKSLKQASTRGTNITWSKNTSFIGNVRELDYTTHKLPTGQWLGYGGFSPAQEPPSPEAKRKLRDRALSAGEASLIPSEGAKAAEAQAKEDALFRSAFSSFAPCKDNSAAVVPEETKNHIWWKTFGTHHFDRTFGIDPTLSEPDGLLFDGLTPDHDEDEETAFRNLVDQFDSIPDPLREDSTEVLRTGSGFEEALMETSELLDVLYSSQRARKTSLNQNQRTGTNQNPSQQPTSGTPPVPTTSEYQNYEKAKFRLADLVGRMPPAALAKVGGDELSTLVVSRHLWLDGSDRTGVLEEDQMSRTARAAALSAALGPSGGSRSFANPATRANQTNQPIRSTAPLSQLSNASSSAPRPPSNYQRQPPSNWQTPAQQLASMQRPPYMQQPNYNRAPSSSYLNNRLGGSQQSSLQNAYPHATSQPPYQQKTQSWTGSPYPRSVGPAHSSQQGVAPLHNSAGSTPSGSTARQPPRASFPAQASQYVPASARPNTPAASTLTDNLRPHTPLVQQVSPVAQRPQPPGPTHGGQPIPSNPGVNGVTTNSSTVRG